MNTLLSTVGSIIYYVFMFFFLPLLGVLLVLLACHHLYLFANHLYRQLPRLTAFLHFSRRQMPARRMARRLATVHA